MDEDELDPISRPADNGFISLEYFEILRWVFWKNDEGNVMKVW